MASPLSILSRNRKIWRTHKKILAAAESVNQPTVIVYQMGKVASTAIYHRLRNRKDCFAFHTHILNENRIAQIKQGGNDTVWSPDRRNRRSEQLSRHIIKPRRPAKIITLVRDPFERNISEFFELAPAVRQIPQQFNKEDLLWLQREFLEHTNHTYPNDWFENEFNAVLQTNIFDYPFRPETGWSEFTTGPYDVLVMHTTLPDSEKSERIEKFLGIPAVELNRANQTGDKSLRSLYQAFKDQIRFPEPIVEEILSMPYSQHFFNKEMRECMREKWS